MRLLVILSLSICFASCSLFDAAEVITNDDAGTVDSGVGPSDSGNSDAGAAEDAATPDDADVVADAESTDGGYDAGTADAGDGGTAACDCRDPDAEPDCETGACALPDLDCTDSADACPTNYGCFDGSRCTCSDELVCGLECSAQSDCPSGQVCVPGLGVCTVTFACYDDRTCPGGTRCRYSKDPSSLEGTCVKSGSVAEGSPCDANEDCSSGVCGGGICLTSCRADFDCDDDQACVQDPRVDTRVCSVPINGCDCLVDEYCDRTTVQCRKDEVCRPGKCDPGFLCVISDGKCVKADATVCNEGELLLVTSDSENVCLDPSATCSEDADCTAPARCLYAEGTAGQFQPIGAIQGFWSASVAVCGEVRF